MCGERRNCCMHGAPKARVRAYVFRLCCLVVWICLAVGMPEYTAHIERQPVEKAKSQKRLAGRELVGRVSRGCSPASCARCCWLCLVLCKLQHAAVKWHFAATAPEWVNTTPVGVLFSCFVLSVASTWRERLPGRRSRTCSRSSFGCCCCC